MIGYRASNDGALVVNHGMYIAGYDSNDMLLFVTTAGYYRNDDEMGIVKTVTSPATAEATKIKLFVYNEWDNPIGAFTPAIEALEFDIQ